MALIHANFYSEALQMSTDINVIIPTPHPVDTPINPDNYFHKGAKYQTLYLLHGTHGDYGDWPRLTSIEKYAQFARLMIVVPSYANSFGQDMELGPKYFTYLTEELPQFVQTVFPSSDKREDNYISGLSMGAFTAFNLGIRRPDLYGKVAGLSGGIDFLPRIDATMENPPWNWKAILPAPHDGVGTKLDTVAILKEQLAAGVKLPEFYLAVGTEDFIYDAAVETTKIMGELGVPLTYEEGPGIHDWDFWDTYIQRIIEWLDLKKMTV